MIHKQFKYGGVYTERYTEQRLGHTVVYVHDIFIFVDYKPHPTQMSLVGCVFFQIYPQIGYNCVYIDRSNFIPTFKLNKIIKSIQLKSNNDKLNLDVIDGLSVHYFNNLQSSISLGEAINEIVSEAGEIIEVIIQSDKITYENVVLLNENLQY